MRGDTAHEGPAEPQQINKSDRNDAGGIAQMMRVGRLAARTRHHQIQINRPLSFNNVAR
jgi:hypothetical protein